MAFCAENGCHNHRDADGWQPVPTQDDGACMREFGRSRATAMTVMFTGLLGLLPMALMSAPAVAAVAAEPACSAASTVFCNGFEDGNLSVWDDYDGNPSPWNLLMSDPGPLNLSGNSVMRLRVPAGRGTADLVKVLPVTADKLYLRWYQKWEPGYDFSAANHGSGLHAGSRDVLGRSGIRPNGADRITATLEPYNGRLALYAYYRGMYQDCSDPNGSCYGDQLPCMADEGSNYCTKPAHRERIMPPQLQTNQWYCLEMMIDGGAPSAQEAGASGVMNYWIDNVEYGPWNSLWLRTTASLKLSIAWISLFHHGEHSTEGVVVDNVVVATNRIGCSGSPTVTPNPPTNLTAN